MAYLLLVLGAAILVALASRRHLRRASRAEPWYSEARRSGFQLNDEVNSSVDVVAAARQAAQTALAVSREVEAEPPTDLEPLRERLDSAAASADSAAEHASALARSIRLHYSEIMHAAESSPLKLQLLKLAGSEAMEYRVYAEDTASALDEAADQARRAAAEARARGGGLPQ